MNPKESITLIKITLPKVELFKTPFINIYGVVNRADEPTDVQPSRFLWEDGSAILWEDGGLMLLENQK